MTVLWIFVFAVLVVLAITTVVDIAQRSYSGWTKAGWIALVVILPLVGSLVYWVVRPTPPGEAERRHLADADLHRTRGERL
jgi:hypothetical protein